MLGLAVNVEEKMEELIKTNMLSYALAAAFTGYLLSLIVFGIFKKTKNIESKKKKALIRFIVNGVLVCFWIWFFIYMNLFPISLAYYEYNHNLVEEKTGVVESIEQDGKDRINIIIDDTEYTIVHSSVNPVFIIGGDIDKGDNVKIIFGVNSKFIFDIMELQ